MSQTQRTHSQHIHTGLGFSSADSTRLCTSFSGGWQMRIALAQTLLSAPTLLLLDEPSNHLDSAARRWLTSYLSDYDGSLLLVSHDERLLEGCANSIGEIVSGSLVSYRKTSYPQYLIDKEFRAKVAWTEYEKNVAEAERLQDFVDRFGASATKAKSAQSRVKAIEKMKQEGLLDKPPESVVETRFKPVLRLPDPPKAIGDVLIGLAGADIGWGKGDGGGEVFAIGCRF